MKNRAGSIVAAFMIFLVLGVSLQAEARTRKGRTAQELEQTQTWGEAPESGSDAYGATSNARGNMTAPETAAYPETEPGKPGQSNRVLGASESMDKLFPVGTPVPEKDPRAREIREWIHDLGGENHQRQNAIERLSAEGEAAIPALRKALKDPYKFTRVGALAALAHIRSKSTLGDMEGMVSDRAAEVRAEAVKSLGIMKHKKAMGLVVERLSDPDWRVRREAVIALGRFKTTEARDQLIAILDAPGHGDLRNQAAQELANFSGPEVVSALIRATYESDLKLRIFAVHALGEIGDGSARARLTELSKEPNRSLREEAFHALQELE